MANINLIILKVNGLNIPIKGHSLSDWINKHMIWPYAIQEVQFRYKIEMDRNK